MGKENFYLTTLNHLSLDLKQVIDNKNKYTPSVYNSILAGIIIRMNTLNEHFMLDFHGPAFSPVVDYIYSSRQELVHYSDFTNLKDLSEVASRICTLIAQNYTDEKAYFDNVLNDRQTVEHNVVVSGDKNITYDRDNNSYMFTSDTATIWVSEDKVVRIKDTNNDKGILYVISCDKNMNCFYKENGEIVYEELIAPEELKRFFKNNFNVVDVDYEDYVKIIESLINKFYKKGNYATIYVCPKDNPNERKKIGKVLNAYFNRNVIYRDLLAELDYSSIKVPANSFFNYKQIKNTCADSLNGVMNKRDYFFIYKAISSFDNINKKMAEAKDLSEKEYKYLQTTLLLGWADNVVRTMRSEFVQTNDIFNKLYTKLVEYRTFFAHNPMQFKSDIYKEKLDEFYELSKGFVSVLTGLDVETFKDEDKLNIDFVSVSRDASKFYIDRNNQYLEVDPTTYIGNKLFYANKINENQNKIALIPISEGYPLRGAYYERKPMGFVPKMFYGEQIKVSRVNYKTGKKEVVDVNLDDILYLFCAYKGKIEDVSLSMIECANCKKLVLFEKSDRNNDTMHAAYLENIIQDFFYKRTLPYELVQQTKILKQINSEGKIEFRILDKDENVIARVIDKNELLKYNIVSDNKRYGHGR